MYILHYLKVNGIDCHFCGVSERHGTDDEGGECRNRTCAVWGSSGNDYTEYCPLDCDAIQSIIPKVVF
jgi:hypothetical protein